jgi:GNAT superfamily N-acetyltransferase
VIGAPVAVPDQQELTVDVYREADEPAVLALLASAFGRWPRGLDAEPGAFFRWKHWTSPFGPSITLVARLEGRVVGFVGLMPWRLRFGATIRETIRGVDIAVAPTVQRQGVARALIAASRDRYSSDVVLGWSNPNDSSRPGVLKSGRRHVNGTARFVGLGGAKRDHPKRLGVCGPALPMGHAGESAALALADETMLERVLSAPASPERICTAHDPEFLRWRYGHLGCYRAVVSEHPRAGAGIAIFRVQQHGRFSVAHVFELLVERDDGAVARRLVRRVPRKSPRGLPDVHVQIIVDCGTLRARALGTHGHDRREPAVRGPSTRPHAPLLLGPLTRRPRADLSV